MRRTRWTKKPRVTYHGSGGWNLGWTSAYYTDPVTGCGVCVTGRPLPSALLRVLMVRRRAERRRARRPAL